MEITIAYSALGSVGIATSATEGVCGKVEGRGILFDREVPPVEKMLASFRMGELMFMEEWETGTNLPQLQGRRGLFYRCDRCKLEYEF
jgi:hypothetical protein